MAETQIILRQSELQRYHLKKQHRLDLEREAREIKKDEDKMAASLLKAVKIGAKIEVGNLTAKLEFGGRYPAWQKLFVERLGQDAADEVVANTPHKEILVVCSIYDTED